MTRGLLLAFVVLLPVVPWRQAQIDRRAGAFRAQAEVLYLWSGKHVKRFFPGFEGLAADVYWLRTVQYFGGQPLNAAHKRFELLHPLIEITTTLDPRLEIAYRYGAIFLSQPSPVGAGRRNLKADRCACLASPNVVFVRVKHFAVLVVGLNPTGSWTGSTTANGPRSRTPRNIPRSMP